ncbi:MAG TPA: flagellar basal-body protein FlbY [Hyphomonadaceae bacterium]|nr:flagellar basal-body protein FlbY [Hyphomonadaceae bacterium]
MSDATDRADQLLAMTRRLDVLVSAEVEAINARRLDGGSADWDEKERLAHAWRLEVAHLKANPSALSGIGESLKVQLREAAAGLEKKLETHARALGAMKTVTEGLVRSIASEIASARSAPPAYGRHGNVNPATKREASGLALDAKA